MLKQLPKKYIFILGLALCVILLIIFLFLKPSSRSPQLLSTIPAEQAKEVGLDQKISLLFDSPIDASSLSVVSTPAETWDILSSSDNHIVITHKYLFLPYTEYRVVIKRGEINLATLSFTTIKSQSDPRLVQTIEEQMKIDYPLAKITPLDTASYRVVYSAPLTLEISLKNQTFPKDQAITEIKAWVTENGGDASAHKYQVVIPSP